MGPLIVAAPSHPPGGLRPLESYVYKDAAREEHWIATVTPAGRVIGRGNPGLVELVDGRWVPICSEGDFKWDMLDAGRDGRIMAGADGEIGYYVPDSGGRYHYHSLTGLLPESDRNLRNVFDTLQDTRGRMVFVSAGTIVRTDGNSAEIWHAPSSRRMNMWIDDGRILIGGAEGRVFQLMEDGLHEIVTPLGRGIVVMVWSERLGKADWIALCESGLVSGISGAEERFGAVNQWLRRSSPTSFTKLPDGRLAIPTYLNGLFIVDVETGRFTRTGEAEGLLSTYIPKVFAGEGDWIWVVSTRGVNRLSNSSAISFVSNGDGFDGSKLLYADVGTDSILVNAQGGSFAFTGAGDELKPHRESDSTFLSQTKLASVHLGGNSFGIFEFDAHTRRKVVPENADVTAIVASESVANLVYYSADSQLRALRVRNGNYEILASEPMDAKIQSIVEDRDGDLWVAAGPEVTHLSFAASQLRFIVREVAHVVDDASVTTASTRLFNLGGRVFLARDGRLLTKADDGAFRTVPLFQNAEVFDAAATSEDVAWVLVRPKQHDGESLRVVRLTAVDGKLLAEQVGTEGLMAEGQLRNVQSVSADGGKREVWVGTDEGVLRINPELVKVAAAEPVVRATLEQIQNGETRRIDASDVEIPNGQGSVSMGWSAQRAAQAHLFVETRMVGANDHWVAAGESMSREFSGLGDGSYTFEVRTVDALGNPGPVSTASFVVLPPWYRTPTALSGFLITALVLGWASWHYKTRAARRRAEELEVLVEDRTRELEMVNAEKTRFIARMNHEIRNPLNGLLGAVGVLEHYAHSGREGRMMDILRTCADHLSAVVEDVLDFSNIEGGRIVVQERAFSIAEVVESVPRMLLAEAERTGTQVVTEISPEVPPVVVSDPDRIRQILVNFLTNALKYAPGEPVHLEASLVTADEGASLRIAVRDHGPGISEADKAALFSMYGRGRNASKRNSRGMGIGLATCRLLARRMGGEVGVVSGLGEGSEFFLRLPLKVAAAREIEKVAPVAELHKLSCLIIEDQDFNRDILKDMLTRLGCTVDEAASAEAGLELAAINRYDVVFTDLELPDAAPGEILKHLVAQLPPDVSSRPALVVTTAYATENVRQTCMAAGAQAFLPKPMSQSKVLEVLHQIDAARRPSGASNIDVRAAKPPPSRGVIGHLARIRGCEISSVAAEIAGSISTEVDGIRESARQSNVREVAGQAHRILSLASLADFPPLGSAAVRVQNEARAGRLPSAETLAALASAAAGAREKLSSLSSSGEG